MTDKRLLHGLVSYDDDDDDNSQQKRKPTSLTGLVAYGGDDDDDEIEETSEPLTKAIIHKVAETTPRKSNAPVHLKPSTSLTNSPSLANLVRLRTAHAVSAPSSPNLRASSPLIPSRDRDTLSPFLADSPRASDDEMEIDKAPDDEDEEERKKRRMRELLKPKPIEGVEDWGLLPEPEGECDPELEAKVAHFHTLRAAGTHFNTHLLRSKAFRNPHIYAKLVEFVDLDEIGSNFPPEMFNPHGFPSQAFATELVDAQRRMAEERAQQQTAGSRSNIHFVGATTAAVDSTSRVGGGSQFRKDAREIIMGTGVRGGAVPVGAGGTGAGGTGAGVGAGTGTAGAALTKKRSSKWDVPAQGSSAPAGAPAGKDKERDSKRRKE